MSETKRLNGEIVREQRHKAQLSQRELAHRASLSERTVVAAEKGRPVSPRTIKALCDALMLSPEELLVRDDESDDVAIATSVSGVEITIDLPFEEYDPDNQAKLLAAIKELLGANTSVKLGEIRRGSTKQSLISLNREEIESLLWFARRGVVAQLLEKHGLSAKVAEAKAIGDAAATALVAMKTHDNDFDVFLCHNSTDKSAVEKIGIDLRKNGVLPWLDKWELRPGIPWQTELEGQIENIRSAAVFVGPSGIGPWQKQELNAFISEFVSRQLPVIPVILRNCKKTPKLPPFLNGMTWVNFRKRKPKPIDQLIWGITGQRMPIAP